MKKYYLITVQILTASKLDLAIKCLYMQSTTHTHLASQKFQGQDHSFNSTMLLSTYNKTKIQAKLKKGNSY